jgi:hypothetical protein
VSKKITMLFLIFSIAVFSQEKKLAATRLRDFNYAADTFVGTDNLGDHYFIKDNVFIKTDGPHSLEYQNLSFGKITRADIENPLMIALFYESFNTIILLDNQLNEVQEINFTMLNIPIVAHAAGLASQNRLWIYDSLTQQIGFYDYLKNAYQSMTTPLKENLKYYQTNLNLFFWVDVKSDWYACDIFGKIFPLGKIADFERIQFVSENGYLYANTGKLYFQNVKENAVLEITNLDNSFKKFYYKDQILSIFTNRGITNYKIILP